MKIHTALSFDDVLLKPQYSTISSRSLVDLGTKLSPNLKLQIPIIETKMDTITGVEMAIAMSKIGGLAIMPRFDTPQVQADNVKKVNSYGCQVGAAVGVKPGFLEIAKMCVKALQ